MKTTPSRKEVRRERKRTARERRRMERVVTRGKRKGRVKVKRRTAVEAIIRNVDDYGRIEMFMLRPRCNLCSGMI